jgi:small subunit ribosomal protein S6
MKNYEVTFIVDPVLSGDEIEATAQTYVNYLEKVGCHIVHVDKMGLRPMAYEIKRRSSGVYFCVEFSSTNGDYMDEFELALRRDERLLRFLTVALDKFGVKYNEDKRKGLINKKKKAGSESKSAPVAAAPAAPAVVEAPVAEAVPEVKAEEFVAAAEAEAAAVEAPTSSDEAQA